MLENPPWQSWLAGSFLGNCAPYLSSVSVDAQFEPANTLEVTKSGTGVGHKTIALPERCSHLAPDNVREAAKLFDKPQAREVEVFPLMGDAE